MEHAELGGHGGWIMLGSSRPARDPEGNVWSFGSYEPGT
jgi:hypothetical protein